MTVGLSSGTGAGYEWISTGRLYAESRPFCSNGSSCVALENLRTGSVSLRRHPALYDLNRAGAPALGVCVPLRGRLSRARQIAEPGYFAFADGVLGLPSKSDEAVELLRCKHSALILQKGAIPRDFQLGSGILTWDTGYPLRESAPEEALPGPATLNSYQLLRRSHHPGDRAALAVRGGFRC